MDALLICELVLGERGNASYFHLPRYLRKGKQHVELAVDLCHLHPVLLEEGEVLNYGVHEGAQRLIHDLFLNLQLLSQALTH